MNGLNGFVQFRGIPLTVSWPLGFGNVKKRPLDKGASRSRHDRAVPGRPDAPRGAQYYRDLPGHRTCGRVPPKPHATGLAHGLHPGVDAAT
jgi:hypothetical protein